MTPAEAALSPGAFRCWTVMRRFRRDKGGVVRVSWRRLGRILARSTRTVARYVAEIAAAGLLTVVRGRRVYDPDGGWRSIESNAYRLHPPERHSPRSHRRDRAVTPPPFGGLSAPRRAAGADPQPFVAPIRDPQSDGLAADAYRRGLAAARQALRAARSGASTRTRR